MFSVLKKIIKTGKVTERIIQLQPQDEAFHQLGLQVKAHVTRHFAGSVAIRAVDAGSCNGCELEIHAINNAFYNCEQYGVHFVASPRHADILLVTGPMSKHMEEALLRAYKATPDPKWVIAMGDCAINGGVFGENYATLGAVEHVIPVDVRIAGCAPTPTQLLQGILALMQQTQPVSKQ
jgi:Ni,Fe-hydrogenase III small subunit